MRRRREKKRKDITKIILLVMLLVVAAEAALVLYKRSDWRFLIKEAVVGMFRSSDMKALSQEDALREGLNLTVWDEEQLLDTKVVIREDSMLLINEEYHVPGDVSDAISEYKSSGVLMNSCIMSSYEALAADCKRTYGESLYVSSGYRTAEKQKEIVATSAEHVAAEVGASEHQAGLALDVYFSGYAGKAILKCEAGQYLDANCWRHGFIIRYPFGKSRITDTAFEPWHIRYVGVPHAEIMYLDGLVLEEYMELLSEADYYRYGDYLITRQEKEPFLLPQDFESGVISKDNAGGYLITLKLGK